MIRSRCCLRVALTLLCAGPLMGGCSKGPARPRLVPVTGRVVYKDRPVGLASIEFLPDMPQGAQGFAAGGQTKPDGTFTLQTYPHGPGAVPGHYRVTITTEARGAIPRRYADPGETPLKVEVPEQGAPDLHLLLTD